MECRNLGHILAYLGILLIAEWIRDVKSVSTEQDLTLTRKEKEALDQFRKQVVDTVPHEYMKQDIYLIRWLRAKDLDLNQAEQMLLENLKWRKENNIDTILEEDFTELDREYPYQMKFHDKEGKPIVTANFGDWNLRKLAFSGNFHKFNRRTIKAFEDVTHKIRQLQAEGKMVTQFDYIINMENFNLAEQGCLQCLPVYFYLVNTYEMHYPGSAAKIMFINETEKKISPFLQNKKDLHSVTYLILAQSIYAPAIFQIVLNAVRPVMSPLTRQTLKVYNTNKQQWQSELFKMVDRNQLPVEYGGTNEV